MKEQWRKFPYVGSGIVLLGVLAHGSALYGNIICSVDLDRS
jgi:hypothetical protein